MNKYVVQDRLLVGSFPSRTVVMMLPHPPAEPYSIHHIPLLHLHLRYGWKYYISLWKGLHDLDFSTHFSSRAQCIFHLR